MGRRKSKAKADLSTLGNELVIKISLLHQMLRVRTSSEMEGALQLVSVSYVSQLQ